MMTPIPALVILLILSVLLALPSFAADRPAGVAGDGKTDDTAALQAALDAVGVAGGTLELPPGHYLIAGSLSIPTGVCLQGGTCLTTPPWTRVRRC